MNYIDIQSDNKDSLTMENYGSETSATSSFIPPQMNGGNWFFGGNENNQKAIQACKEHEFAALSFLIRHDMVTDYGVQDPDTGSTILHCVAKHFSNIPDVQDVLVKILTNKSVSSFINIKNKTGCTPLHIALSQGNQPLVNLLIRAGADPKIRNNEGKYIATDDECSIMGSETSPYMPQMSQMSATSASVFAPKAEGKQGYKRTKRSESPKQNISDVDNSDVNDIVNMLLALNSKQQPQISEYSTDMPSSFRSPSECGDVSSELFNTDKFLNEILEGTRRNVLVNPSKKMNSSDRINMMPMNLQTNRYDSNPNLLVGGSKGQTVISGSRRMNLYSEFEDLTGGWDRQTRQSDRRGRETSDEHTNLKQSYRDSNRSTAIRDNESDWNDYGQPSRVTGSRSGSKGKSGKSSKSGSKSRGKQSSRIPDQTSESLDFEYDSTKDYNQQGDNRSLTRHKSQVDIIHKRTVEKIQAIMNVDSDTAKNYKAVLYRKVKEEHPELGGYDRAIEMEKLATKENLDKIDINKVTQEIREYMEKKKKERESANIDTSEMSETSEEPSKKKRSTRKKATDTSSISVASETGLSPTSDGWY